MIVPMQSSENTVLLRSFLFLLEPWCFTSPTVRVLCFNLSASRLWSRSFEPTFDAASLIWHEGPPSERSITFLKNRQEGALCVCVWGGSLYTCGRWASDCTASCEGRRSVGAGNDLTFPLGDNNPRCFEHPGSPRAPTKGNAEDYC